MNPTTATTDSQTEQLLLLVAGALTLTDDEKNACLGRILEGIVPTAFEGDGFKAFCDREEVAAKSEVDGINDEIAALELLRDSEEQAVAADAADLVSDQREGTASDIAEFNQECSNTERDLEKAVEGDVRSGEASEADAIRAMLKQRPDQK